MTRVEFLKARLDVEEAAARAATPGPWRYNPRKEWHTDPDKLSAARAGIPQAGGEEFVGAGPLTATIGVAATGPANHPQSMADAEHIALHDPARVLAEVDAKRRIIDAVMGEMPGRGDRTALRHQILKLLALPYADHPEYRDEWRPDVTP